MTITRRGFILKALPMPVALTGAVAAVFAATPISIDLGHSDPDGVNETGIRIKVDTAEAIVGRPATPRSAAGVARRTTRRAVRRRYY